jgi:hypothetical protein
MTTEEENFEDYLRQIAALVTVQESSTSSKTTGEYAEALSKAQGAMSGALKDKKNPFFKSNYADLEAIWSVAREPLSRNSLAVTQHVDRTGKVMVTKITHKSGEWERGFWPFTPEKQNAQGMGSAGSYARRYGLASMIGIFQTDDDGNAACGISEEKQSSPPTSRPSTSSNKPKISTPQPKQSPDDIPIDMAKEVFGGEEVPRISQERVAKLRESLKKDNVDEAKFLAGMKVKLLENLSQSDYTRAVRQIRTLAKGNS